MRTVLATLVLATPLAAQTADEIAAMTTAIEQAGCVVTAENGDAVLDASGLDQDQTMAVIAAMYADGLVALQSDGTMKLTNETCQ